jgi:hypothetical protein
MNDLSKLNALASVGFRVVSVVQEQHYREYEAARGMVTINFALLERPLP